MIRRLAQFWLCWQLLKKKGVKWTKSDFSLLLCIPAQNCKLDLRFSLSKNYRSFDFLSKHNISSELTMCLSYHTSMSICSASCTKLIHTRKDSYMAVNAHSVLVKPFASFSCRTFLAADCIHLSLMCSNTHLMFVGVFLHASFIWCVFHASFQLCVLNLIVAFKNCTFYEDLW